LRPSQRLKYGFVGISGHLTSFFKCSHDLFVRDTMARQSTRASRMAGDFPRRSAIPTLAAVFFGPRVNAVLAFCFQMAAMRPYRRDGPRAEMSEYHTLPQ
jgi:hypothetical protein